MNKKERSASIARAKLKEKDPDAIHRKKLAAEEARREHEEFHLKQEQERYGLKQRGKPLSRMPF